MNEVTEEVVPTVHLRRVILRGGRPQPGDKSAPGCGKLSLRTVTVQEDDPGLAQLDGEVVPPAS